jgi:hypothetical protein
MLANQVLFKTLPFFDQSLEPEKESIQYLEAILDSNLKSKEHVNYLMKKILKN